MSVFAKIEGKIEELKSMSAAQYLPPAAFFFLLPRSTDACLLSLPLRRNQAEEQSIGRREDDLRQTAASGVVDRGGREGDHHSDPSPASSLLYFFCLSMPNILPSLHLASRADEWGSRRTPVEGGRQRGEASTGFTGATVASRVA